MTSLYRLAAAFGVAMLAGVAFAGGANAQSFRTWVSGVGDDVNPCSRTAPCKTFAGAISKTASGGEINTLDPGAFGTLTITKPISIIVKGGTGGVLAGGDQNGITISPNFQPTGGRVVLKGLDLEGLGSGINGVNIVGPARVVIEDAIIRDFRTGVNIDGPLGARLTLNRVTILHNSVSGVAALGANSNELFIQDSLIDTSTIALNAGAAAQVVVTNSTFSGSTGGRDVTVAAGGIVQSYGDNIIRTGSATTTIPLK